MTGRAAQKTLFAKACVFLGSCTAWEHLPEATVPEVVFIGRSNVGKSSLVSALVGAKIARVSKTPGRTRQLNFFALRDEGGESLRLVDMPGYGFARASGDEIRSWTALSARYIAQRSVLRLLCVLIDSRRGLMARDVSFLEFLAENPVSFCVVLTKADKLKAGALGAAEAEVAEVLRGHPAARGAPIITSAKTGVGVDVLRGVVAGVG